MACNMNRRASVVEWPLHANFRWSIFPCNYGSSLLLVNPSMTFASVQVRAIGWRSLFISLGGFTFRTGVTMKDFRSDGMYPSLRDWLFRMTEHFLVGDKKFLWYQAWGRDTGQRCKMVCKTYKKVVNLICK